MLMKVASRRVKSPGQLIKIAIGLMKIAIRLMK